MSSTAPKSSAAGSGNEGWSFVPPDKKIGTASLAMIIFYSVSGGPFGMEGSVRAGGFLYSILGFIIMPFLLSVPEALITAELGSAFQEASGGMAWSEEAFGSLLGWVAGKNSLFAGVSDAALFLVLLLEYVLQLFQIEAISTGLRFLLIAVLAIVLGWLNWLGLETVGKVSMVIAIFSLSPFVVMCAIGVFHLDTSRWSELPSEEFAESHEEEYNGLFQNLLLGSIIWRPFINNLFWNCSAIQYGSHFAGDVKDVGRTLPRAMAIVIVLLLVFYLAPLLVAIGATTSSQEDWVDGYLATAAVEIGGKWLGGWVVAAAAVSNIALFQVELSKNAFLIAGMAERGFIPAMLATRSVHGTATYPIVMIVFVVMFLGTGTFERLVEFVNITYSISLLIYFASFVKLRISYPNMGRPFRVPLGTFGCFLIVLPTMALLVFIILSASYGAMLFGLITNVVSLAIYFLKDRIEYSKIDPKSSTSHLSSDDDLPSIEESTKMAPAQID